MNSGVKRQCLSTDPTEAPHTEDMVVLSAGTGSPRRLFMKGHKKEDLCFKPRPQEEVCAHGEVPATWKDSAFLFSGHVSDEQAQPHDGKMVTPLSHTGSQERWVCPDRTTKRTLKGESRRHN